jgi:ATP-dependent Clp protease ATP-binding subunit ClpA
VARASQEVANGFGSSQIEAEHILLALAEGAGDDRAARALRDEGLDAETLREAVERDAERVLAQVGIDVSGFELPARPKRRKSPRFGASAKRALEQSLKVAIARGDKRIGTEHLLLGLLSAERGAVPRLLAAEGVDPAQLAERVG